MFGPAIVLISLLIAFVIEIYLYYLGESEHVRMIVRLSMLNGLFFGIGVLMIWLDYFRKYLKED